jgi:hypothetical protein
MNITRFLAGLCLVFVFALSISQSQAEPMRVRARGSYGEKQIDLAKGQLGKIEVHLKSAGEMVGGYEVSLFQDSDGERIATKISDDYGIVTFGDLRPGTYTAILLRSDRMKSESTLAIGDFVLEAYYPSDQAVQNDSENTEAKEESSK